MTITLTRKHALILFPFILGYILTLTSFSPFYYNHHFRPHRWFSDVCVKNGLAAEQCEFELKFPNKDGKPISTEHPVFDFCLEHGETRRVK